jgi:ribonuclease HI
VILILTPEYLNVLGKYTLLQKSLQQTEDRAEIEALSKALDTIYAFCDTNYSVTQIYIATSSKSLYTTMTDHIYDWVEDGGVRLTGKEANNFDEFKKVHELLGKREYGEDGGIEVKFWCRSSEENGEASALALHALK